MPSNYLGHCRSSGIPLSRAAVLVGASMVAALPAWSQTRPASSSGSDQPEEVVVTGSRIARVGFDMPTPTTVLNAEDLAKTGITNIGQITNAIPAFQAVNTPTGSSFTSVRAGGNYLNLRGLGDNRTLILVDGRRFVPTNSEATVDTNVIPTALVDRIDIVTGGASAAYGSDAVAGVVNILLKKRMEGFVGDFQSGISAESDNETYRGSLAWGTGFGGDAGNFMIAAEGERNDGIGRQTDRDWARGAFSLVNNPAGGTPLRLIAPDAQFSLQTLGGLVLGGPLAGTDFGPGGVARPFAAAPSNGFSQIGGSGVRGSDYMTLSVPFERWSVYSKGDYDFGGVRLFAEASHSWSQGDLPIIPASNFGSITIQQDNAYLAPALRTRLQAGGATSFRMGRFFADLGPLTVVLTNETTRFVTGLEGSLGDRWTWTVHGEYGQTRATNKRGNNQNLALFARSVDAVNGPNGPVCRVNANASPADDDPACVPVNLFGDGSPNEAAKRYFLGTSVLDSQFDQRVVAATISGDVWELPAGAASVAGGAEYRTSEVVAVADPISQANGFAFGNPKSLGGEQTVSEAFAEFALPILRDKTAFKSLNFDAAVRATDYSGSGNVMTWKGGLTWDITESVRLRTTRSRDIRAPNLGELFGTSNVNFVTLRDPFRGTTVNVPEITRGNSVLEPEEADTVTAGIVLTPGFLPGFRFSVDYYDIQFDNAVTILTSQDTLDRCFAGNTDLCQFATRNSAGLLTQMVRTQVNVAQATTTGYDLEAGYTFEAGGGSVTIRGLATYVDELSTANGGVKVDRAGEVGGTNVGLPNWRYNISGTWERGPLSLYGQYRYVGGGKYDNTFTARDINDNSVDSASYVDLTAQYSLVDDGRRSIQLFAVVNNVFNEEPPITPSNSFVSFQTNPVLYDVIGRMYSVGARFRF
jgi:iron complex outermembrane receptor protein